MICTLRLEAEGHYCKMGFSISTCLCKHMIAAIRRHEYYSSLLRFILIHFAMCGSPLPQLLHIYMQPRPPRMYKGHAYSHLLGKGGVFWPFVSGIFFPRKPGKGGDFRPISRVMGCFSLSFLRNVEKGGMIHTYMFPEPSIAPREKGIGPLLHCNSVVGPLEGSGKIRTHIS